jgi:hypothetical protein
MIHSHCSWRCLAILLRIKDMTWLHEGSHISNEVDTREKMQALKCIIHNGLQLKDLTKIWKIKAPEPRISTAQHPNGTYSC